MLIAGLIGAGLGLIARRRYEIAAAAFIGFGVLGFLATLGDPLATPAVAAVATAVAIGAGLLVLGWLLDISPPWSRRPRRRIRAGSRRSTRVMPARPLVAPTRACRTGRAVRSSSGRVRSGSARSRSASSAATSSSASGRRRSAMARPSRRHPSRSRALTPEQDLSPTIAGLTPIVMPNDRFYRIDTAFLTPSVNTAGWTLRIFGMVDRETTLTWDQLIAAARCSSST